MKITIAGSLGNITRPLAQKLVSSKHMVTVITSNNERVAEIEALGAKAAVGSINDAEFLKNAFKEADAVYTMVPPNIGGENIISNTAIAGQSIAKAIRGSGVKRVVQLSSIGADKPSGTGPITGLHKVEQELNKLENISITFLRAGYFYLNLYSNISLIKNMGILGSNWPSITRIPLVYPEDIATAATEELTKNQAGINIRYIVSDVAASHSIAQEIGTAINKPELTWTEFTDVQSLDGMKQAGVPEEIAQLYMEMGIGLRNGSIQEDFFKKDFSSTGKIKLADFAKEFAKVYAL